MANILAAQSGFYDLPSTWVGGVVPVDGDTVDGKTFVITIRDGRTIGDGTDAIVSSDFNGGGEWIFESGCDLSTLR